MVEKGNGKQCQPIIDFWSGLVRVFTVLSSQSAVLFCYVYRGSYMSAHVLLNFLNELGKRDKIRGLPAFCLFFATRLINSIIQEQEC